MCQNIIYIAKQIDDLKIFQSPGVINLSQSSHSPVNVHLTKEAYSKIPFEEKVDENYYKEYRRRYKVDGNVVYFTLEIRGDKNE